MQELLKSIETCNVCASSLALGPRPVVTAHPESKLIIIGQAPGLAVHASGIPWDDKSGDNLEHGSRLINILFTTLKKLP